jgi:hypothetical protein
MTTIKTITRTWSPMFRSSDSPGPEVDFDESNVSWVEYCCDRSLPESARTYYLYRKNGLSTLTVAHSELERFPALLKEGMESYDCKIHAPDPLMGSCT